MEKNKNTSISAIACLVENDDDELMIPPDLLRRDIKELANHENNNRTKQENKKKTKQEDNKAEDNNPTVGHTRHGVNLTMEDELVYHIKVLAAKKGKRLWQVLDEAVRLYLKAEGEI